MMKIRQTKGMKIKGIPIEEIMKNYSMEEPILEEETYKTGYVQWGMMGSIFYPIRKTKNILPSGYYSIKWRDDLHLHVLDKQDIIIDDLLILPDKSFDSILKDINIFWKNKKEYIKYNYIYKRGILLYGIAGCGKTSLINLICCNLIKNQNGIVINIKEHTDIYRYDDVITYLREIEPDRCIITIMEDIDNFIGEHDTELTTKLLNILDGNLQTDNIVTIATTNYPEKLKERVMNRPSHFDRLYEIGKPDETVREFYIKKKLKSEDLKKINIKDWIKRTEGFTIDHLKELLLMVFVLEYDFEEAIATITDMVGTRILKNKHTNNKKIGFDKD